MIYTTRRGETFDLGRDFSSAERHILQKLMCWRDLAGGVADFRAKKQESLLKGWGDSGPVQESRNLQSLTRDLEEQVGRRVRGEKQGRQ
ncbi:MAG TPA: hypothetical protein VIN67_06480 [Desulfobaccales bacterium]